MVAVLGTVIALMIVGLLLGTLLLAWLFGFGAAASELPVTVDELFAELQCRVSFRLYCAIRHVVVGLVAATAFLMYS